MLGFLSGWRKPDRQKAGGPMLPAEQRHRIYIAATAIVVCVALLLVLFGNRGSALQRCEGAILQSQRSACLDTLAGIENNASICSLIGYAQVRDSCIASVAEHTANITLCTHVAATNEMAGCVLSVSNATRNINDCAFAGAPYNSTCAYNIASEDRFASAYDCALIGNATLRSECAYLHDYSNATTGENASYCTALPDTHNMSLLEGMFDMNITTSPQFFEFSLINATPQSYCYYHLALNTQNRSLCDFLSGSMGTLCNANFTHPTQSTNITNETVCNYAPAGLKSACEYGLLSARAVSEKNVSLCMQISNTTDLQYQYSCISAIAMRYNDSSYCSYINNSTIEQNCVISAKYAKSASNETV